MAIQITVTHSSPGADKDALVEFVDLLTRPSVEGSPHRLKPRESVEMTVHDGVSLLVTEVPPLAD